MSGKLDQSLDEILSSRKDTARRGRGRRAPTGARATKAPVGGIQKSTRAARVPAAKATTTNGDASAVGGTKIIVSNLPNDVNETQIKEYFSKSVAPVLRVQLTYGPNGVSRGIATIQFKKPGSANEAMKKLNGMLVDKRPMKIEVVLDASATLPPPKGLSERMTQPRSAAPKAATNGATAARGGRPGRGRGGRKGGRPGRPKAKTADELDAEMADYFVPGTTNGATATDNAAATNGAAAPAANGEQDMGMDEIS